MRGEWEEFNPWQEPMGSAVPAVLEAMGVEVRRISEPGEVAAMVSTAADDVFGQDKAVALLISQKLIGKKVW
jgi:sulfopyruvate decarboxylase TPP-binding subunit